MDVPTSSLPISSSTITVNTHPMFTHSKVDIYKLKVFSVYLSFIEPRNVKQALSYVSWK